MCTVGGDLSRFDATRVMIRCPTLNWPVFTGLTTELIKLDSMCKTMTLTVHCPACSSDHKWKREDAWVDEPDREQVSGLGAGDARLYLPVWIQKSFGDWTTYGGGYWINHGRGMMDQDYWFFGWLLQKQVTKTS